MKRVIVRKLRFVPVSFRWSVMCPACPFTGGSSHAAPAIATADRHARTQHPKGPAVSNFTTAAMNAINAANEADDPKEAAAHRREADTFAKLDIADAIRGTRDDRCDAGSPFWGS